MKKWAILVSFLYAVFVFLLVMSYLSCGRLSKISLDFNKIFELLYGNGLNSSFWFVVFIFFLLPLIVQYVFFIVPIAVIEKMTITTKIWLTIIPAALMMGVLVISFCSTISVWISTYFNNSILERILSLFSIIIWNSYLIFLFIFYKWYKKNNIINFLYFIFKTISITGIIIFAIATFTYFECKYKNPDIGPSATEINVLSSLAATFFVVGPGILFLLYERKQRVNL